MSRLNTYTNNLPYFLIILLLLGCGYTPEVSSNKLEIVNGNSTSPVSNEFNLKKLESASDFDQLPKEFAKYKRQIGQFDFYLAQSPTQKSSGYTFEFSNTRNLISVCLKKPNPADNVLTVLTNPIALIKITKEGNVKINSGYCNSQLTN